MFRNPGGIPGKTLCKVTRPDLMEAIHRWKSGLLLGGKAQTLNSTRQITAKSFCACRKYMPEKKGVQCRKLGDSFTVKFINTLNNLWQKYNTRRFDLTMGTLTLLNYPN